MIDREQLAPATWADVKDGDTVWIDNYQDGKFPRADPRISGPYRVKRVKDRLLETVNWRYNASFCHLPNNLLVRPETP